MATTTFTAKKAVGPIDAWFKSAAGGKGVRIKYGRKVYLLFDARRIPQSYAEREYGVTPKELDNFAKRMNAQNKKELKAGLAKTFTGSIEEVL